MSADDYAKVIEAALENSELPRGHYEALRYELLTDFAIVKAGETEYVLGSLERDKALADLLAACDPEALHALLEERKAMQQGISAVAMRLAQDSSYRHRASEDLLKLLPGITTTADNQPETGKE